MERPHPWRVFWSPDIHRWVACRWDEKGGVCTAKNLEAHAAFKTVGKFLRFENAEAKIGTQMWVQNGNVECDVLRMVPKTQVVEAEVVRAGAAARGPR
jgi:hypothetical protein